MIKELDDYMFSQNRIKMEEIETNIKIDKKINSKLHLHYDVKKESDFFIPKKKDTLFWCFYIGLKGLNNFKLIENYFVEENKFKIETIEKSRNYKYLFKENKIKVNIFESDLLMEKKINLITFKALCLFYNLNFVVIRKKTYLEFINDKSKPIFLIEENKDNKVVNYGIKSTNIYEKYEFVKKNLYYIENVNKILNSISSYKLADLQKIAENLKITIDIDNKKKTKQQLYQNIFNELE